MSMICHLKRILVYDAINSKNNGSSTCVVQVDWFNTLLNYALIIINVATVVSILHRQVDAIPTRFASCICLAFVISFQLCLCLFVADCVGVSIIWCSTFGWLLMCMQTLPSLPTRTTAPTQPTVARAVAFLDCGAIVFYAVVSDIIE
mmetsp:Transcript_23397/g.46591  ORF Transcript_23397/g.46591 Transcript_23397/m.46591 type:complete len:147 (-) Transcript_23397:1246-1686(-)